MISYEDLVLLRVEVACVELIKFSSHEVDNLIYFSQVQKTFTKD